MSYKPPIPENKPKHGFVNIDLQHKTLTASVSESGKAGLYKFDVTSSFFNSHGTGSYGVLIEVNSLSPSVIASNAEVLYISKADLDNISATAEVDSDSIASAVWDKTTTNHTGSNTFGEKVGKKLLTVAKFLGLK